MHVKNNQKRKQVEQNLDRKKTKALLFVIDEHETKWF